MGNYNIDSQQYIIFTTVCRTISKSRLRRVERWFGECLAGGACQTLGLLRTVRIVGLHDASDVTITVAREAPDADFRLFVHSGRASHQDAAALFALMRHVERPSKVAARR